MTIKHVGQYKLLGSHVRKLRKSKKMTLENLSNESGINSRAISRVEIGSTRSTDPLKLKSILMALQMEEKEIISLFRRFGMPSNYYNKIS